MNVIRELLTCLLCGSSQLAVVAELRGLPVAQPGSGAHWGESHETIVVHTIPLSLNQCLICGQLQLRHVPACDLDFANYPFRTARSAQLVEHYRRYAAGAIERLGGAHGGLALDIGSNDGTLLKFLQSAQWRTLGIDPADAIAAEATAAGMETIADFFRAALARTIRATHGTAALICANYVAEHLDDMDDFAAGVTTLLADDGLLIVETQYGRDVIEQNLLDAIHHEHLSYFRITPLLAFFARHGLDVIDVERFPIKGGAIRVTAQRTGGRRVAAPRVGELVVQEERSGIGTPAFYERFMALNAHVRDELRTVVDTAKHGGGSVAGWGVSIGTSALLAQYELEHDVEFLLDDRPAAAPFLAGTDSRIPILPSSALYERTPALVIVFAWRYAEAIVNRNAAYIDGGGHFVVPLPYVRAIEPSATVA